MSEEKTVAGSARPAQEESFPVGKDELQQLTQVTKAWAEYQTKEKQFSKDLALALIALNKELAKPGFGTFVENLKKLKIPHTTAYRLMKLHGWKLEKRKIEKPKIAEEEINRIAKSRLLRTLRGQGPA
jgi:coproporphyrinogen III oxidase-like Fe-S oxidoreductase